MSLWKIDDEHGKTFCRHFFSFILNPLRKWVSKWNGKMVFLAFYNAKQMYGRICNHILPNSRSIACNKIIISEGGSWPWAGMHHRRCNRCDSFFVLLTYSASFYGFIDDILLLYDSAEKIGIHSHTSYAFKSDVYDHLLPFLISNILHSYTNIY